MGIYIHQFADKLHGQTFYFMLSDWNLILEAIKRNFLKFKESSYGTIFMHPAESLTFDAKVCENQFFVTRKEY